MLSGMFYGSRGGNNTKKLVMEVLSIIIQDGLFIMTYFYEFHVVVRQLFFSTRALPSSPVNVKATIRLPET